MTNNGNGHTAGTLETHFRFPREHKGPRVIQRDVRLIAKYKYLIILLNHQSASALMDKDYCEAGGNDYPILELTMFHTG